MLLMMDLFFYKLTSVLHFFFTEREDVEITESDEDLQEKFKQIVLQLQPYMYVFCIRLARL